MHVQCAADADNILEESMLSRTESISSIDEPKNEVLKSEAPSESMEVETSIVKSEEQPIIKNEIEEVKFDNLPDMIFSLKNAGFFIYFESFTQAIN